MDNFYGSADWKEARRLAILRNIQEHNGDLICEYCGKPIIRKGDCIVHHKEELTELNWMDYAIAYGQDNLMCVHMRCHNEIHGKGFYGGGRFARKAYLLYGRAESVEAWIRDNREKGDLIVYVPDIWLGISGGVGRADNDALLDDVLRTRDFLMDRIHTRAGKWKRGIVAGTYDNRAERDRLVRWLGAEELGLE